MPNPSINPVQQLDREFAQERASALGRLGRAFEAALAALAEFDQAPSDTLDRRQMRSALVAEASVALWQFIVQREACGLRDMRQVLRDYAVPAEVAARMGGPPRLAWPIAKPEKSLTNQRRDAHESGEWPDLWPVASLLLVSSPRGVSNWAARLAALSCGRVRQPARAAPLPLTCRPWLSSCADFRASFRHMNASNA
jgi:hypothetical protein